MPFVDFERLKEPGEAECCIGSICPGSWRDDRACEGLSLLYDLYGDEDIAVHYCGVHWPEPKEPFDPDRPESFPEVPTAPIRYRRWVE